MLSCTLYSEKAIGVNFQVIRVFNSHREMLVTDKDLLLKLELLEQKFLKQDHHQKKLEKDIQLIIQYLKELIHSPEKPRKELGFKTGKDRSSAVR